MLLKVFKEHNKKYRELLNKNVVLGTVLKYERAARYLEEFMKVKYHFSDIRLKSINLEFVKEEELNKLIEKDFTITRMEVARDIFVFCSLTGLAFTDVQHSTPEHIFRTWMVAFGFAKHGKRRIICATYLYLIFHLN